MTPKKKATAAAAGDSDGEITIEVRGEPTTPATPVDKEEEEEEEGGDEEEKQEEKPKRELSKKVLANELELVDVELLPGKDGEVTKARVKDGRGDKIREVVVELRCLVCREKLE